jgi:hypothetical protein
LPTFLFALVFLNLTPAVYGGFQLETLQIFFTVLSAGAGVELILTRSPADAFVAGVAAGCGAMFKPTAVGVLLALCVVLFVFKSEKGEREDAKARRHEEEKSKTHFLLRALRFFASSRSHFSSLSIFFSMLAGLSIPIAFALLYLFNADLIADMPGLYRQISTYAHETVFDLVELLKPITALALLGFPIVIRGVVCRRQRDVRASSPAPAIIAFLLLWLAIETTGVILQRRMYAYHFLPMVPPAALLFGMLPRLNRPVSLAGALVPIAVLSIAAAANLIVTTGPGEARLPLSDYLQSHAKPGDAVWTDAWPRVVLETGLAPGTRLPNTFLFTNYDNAGLDYSAGMLADFERVKPAYIILPTSLDRQLGYQIDFIPELNHRPIRRANYLAGWHHIEQYTLEHYDRETTVGNDAVYHRRGS